MQLVLASQSPRRAQLLTEMGLAFTTCVPDINETQHTGESPIDYVERLAREKAERGYDLGGYQPSDEVVVLGSDTTVVVVDAGGSEQILGKPSDLSDSVRMLKMLSGKAHIVHTAIGLTDGHRSDTQVVSSKVTFKTLSDDDIEKYCATREGFDKAGSYGIQGIGGIFVERIEGSFSAVMGLPVAATEILLQSFNVDTWSMRDQWLKNSS